MAASGMKLNIYKEEKAMNYNSRLYYANKNLVDMTYLPVIGKQSFKNA